MAEHDDDLLFVENGAPVKFFFHRSVTQGRGQITRDIERNGGRVVDNERHANVILVDEQEDLALLRVQYYSSTELYRLSLYVEPRGFVQACIRSGTYCHIAPAKRGMPGRAQGAGRRGRVSFTEEDKHHLAYYLATRCPTRDGRMGNSAYKDLERLGQTDDSSWAWARRHTFHSWREHYKINSETMDVRIAYYLEQLKDVGHHLGHDSRKHDHWRLRQEEEEDSDEQPHEPERREREQVPRAIAAAMQARDRLARLRQDRVTTDDEEDSDASEEPGVAIQESQRAKRHRVHPDARHQRSAGETQVKRARVSEAALKETRASGTEAGPVQEKESDNEESQEIEGSDLFGDSTYGDEPYFEIDESQEIEFLAPLSPRTSPPPEQDGAPLSTQATLVASPRAAEKEKEPTSAPRPTPAKVPEPEAPTLNSTTSPRPQQTSVATLKRVVVPRGRVRGASAQPGPSTRKESRAQGGAADLDAPYRRTRARSRSVDPQPHPQPQSGPESPPSGQQKNQRKGGKGKAKGEVLVPIEEDVHVQEEAREVHTGASVPAVVATGELSTRETPDEIAVEGLLEVSIMSGFDENDGGSRVSLSAHGDDSDMESVSVLPRVQVMEIENEPTDSDDAETHGSLVRGVHVIQEGSPAESEQDQIQDGVSGAREGSVRRGDSASEQAHDHDEDEDSDDGDRIEQMAKGLLQAAPAPTSRKPRVTRPMAATQTRMQTRSQTSPRQTRSESQAHAKAPPTTFPTPGTKARAVVDRFQEEGRRVPYEPPAGSRAAKAANSRRRLERGP